ncbi:MAG: MFS transporter [Muribaculaceae bacterium]|nr:MFS transporter [Muribaculaceae bacterium]
MKYVETGYGKIPYISLLAILSISLVVNLPGLAISPIMGKLDQVFKNVTELEIQLLTVLPNLVTIPFILCSGKICTPKNQMYILGIGLGIYTLTGILYFFASSMIELILLSCLLGVGCGLVIPLAASLISQHFVGKARTKQLGMKSSLSNFSVIFATLFVGWMAAINWHLAFVVYMLPIVPLVLIPFMTDSYIDSHKMLRPAPPFEPKSEPVKPSDDDIKKAVVTHKPASVNFHFQGSHALVLLVGVMALYFGMTYATEVVSYYLPFDMKHYGLNTGEVGVATAMFFAAATVAGFFLTKIIALFKGATVQAGIFLCILGLFVTGLFHYSMSYILGVFIMGLGYGTIQPIIYDKTSYIAPTAAKSTEYFAYLLTCNYIGISCVPFIVSAMKRLFDAQADPNFSFIFNGFVCVAILVLAVIKRKSFVFEADATYYEKPVPKTPVNK